MVQTSQLRTYAFGDRVYVTAQQFWAILAGFVMWGQRGDSPLLITFGKLAEMAGYHDGRAGGLIARQIQIIDRFCLDNDFPQLGSIVVNQPKGMPGVGVVPAGRNLTAEQRRVLAHNWYYIAVPTTGMLRKIWERGV